MNCKHEDCDRPVALWHLDECIRHAQETLRRRSEQVVEIATALAPTKEPSDDPDPAPDE